jgi:N-acetylglucosaminyldiphosphoundecaprenol N-acetyl-beta-D-mannosaminyltransferase
MNRQIRLGKIYADQIDFEGAIAHIVKLAKSGGGYVVTPNVDHVVIAEHEPEFLKAYQGADLSLVDGQPLVWMARAMGERFPGKISGSDLVRPLCAAAATEGLSIYILGATPPTVTKAIEILCVENPGLRIAGHSSPMIPVTGEGREVDAAMAHIRSCKPDIILVAIGSPKQELLMSKHRANFEPAVAIGIGAAIDFIAGTVKRSPEWMSRSGLEWLYRLSREPRRLAHRYLVRDRQIVPIFFRMLKMPREQRVSVRQSRSS